MSAQKNVNYWNLTKDTNSNTDHLSLVVVRVKEELVASGSWPRVAHEADACILLANAELIDDGVDEVEYGPPTVTRWITAANRHRAIHDEDDVRPRELARYPRYTIAPTNSRRDLKIFSYTRTL